MPQNNAMPFFKRTGNVKEGQIEETVKAQWNPGDSNPQTLDYMACAQRLCHDCIPNRINFSPNPNTFFVILPTGGAAGIQTQDLLKDALPIELSGCGKENKLTWYCWPGQL